MVWEQWLYALAGMIWAVAETHAIVDGNDGDTLSETLRSLFSYKRQGRLKVMRRGAFILFWVWFLAHITTGFV